MSMTCTLNGRRISYVEAARVGEAIVGQSEVSYMAYQKHKWVNKEIIKADQLNHLEDGIYNEEQRAMQAEELATQSVTNETTRATQAENVLGNRVSVTENAITTLNGNEQVVGSVEYKIAQAMSEMGGYKVVADHTVVADPSDKYIYLEPDLTVAGSDKFKEWIWIDYETPGVFEWYMTGDTSLDLSDYIKNTDFATASTPGIVIVDGTTITINNGVITANVAGGVTGVKGSSESSYRTGNVEITAANIGLGDVGNFKAVSTVANQGLSDTEKANARSNIGAGSSSFSGDYNDLANKPDLKTVATTGSYSDLTNKPTLGTAAALDVAVSGDASSTQVVKGDDTRLSDARTPTSHTHTKSQITDFPTIPGGVKSGTSRSGATDTTLYFIRS